MKDKKEKKNAGKSAGIHNLKTKKTKKIILKKEDHIPDLGKEMRTLEELTKGGEGKLTFGLPTNFKSILIPPEVNERVSADLESIPATVSFNPTDVERVIGYMRKWGKTYGINQPEITALKLLIDRGDTPDSELAELLAEISILYRMQGGSGINFEFMGVSQLQNDTVCKTL